MRSVKSLSCLWLILDLNWGSWCEKDSVLYFPKGSQVDDNQVDHLEHKGYDSVSNGQLVVYLQIIIF